MIFGGYSKIKLKFPLKRLRHSHLNKVIFSYLNINSIRNTFGDLDKIVDGNTDILCTAEAKLDESFLFVYQCYQSICTGYYQRRFPWYHRQQRWLDGIY